MNPTHSMCQGIVDTIAICFLCLYINLGLVGFSFSFIGFLVSLPRYNKTSIMIIITIKQPHKR